MLALASLLCGFIFGVGLLISGMVQPTKVIGFLDIFGAWDPSLAVVMASALAVTSAGFGLTKRNASPLLAPQCLWPDKIAIDRPLLIGSALFGAGWGLVGFCPGPALVKLSTSSLQVWVFVAAMAVGIVGHTLWQNSQASSPRRREVVPTASDG
jgi:uncharacterized protein